MSGRASAQGSLVDRSAFVRKLEKTFGMDKEDAGAIAETVLSLFESTSEVNDDLLPSDVRSILYTLEKHRIVTFRREEYRNEEGEIRRAFYWRIRKEALEEEKEDAPPAEDPYSNLPPTVWSRRNLDDPSLAKGRT